MSANGHTNSGARHDFVLLFDVVDGNPNGDPDADNMPRFDPETMHGWVTDACLKRKVRDYVFQVHDQDIYVKHRGILAAEQRRAYEMVGATPSNRPNDDARRVMCEIYYDVRMFGAVMTTGRSELRGRQWNCGQVRGPMQLGFARSIDPITPLDLAISRVAVTNPDDAVGAGQPASGPFTGQMGRRELVPYALYQCRGAFNPYLAERTGVSDQDLTLFWEALINLWDLDRSSRRGFMACRGLYIFTHASKLGSAPAHALAGRIRPKLRNGGPVRQFSDYSIDVDDAGLPQGVQLTRLAG